MRALSTIALVLLFAAPASVLSGQAPAAPQEASPPPPLNLKDVPLFSVRAEAALRTYLQDLHPLMEVYVQPFVADDKPGSVPTADDYTLGLLQWKNRPSLEKLGADSKTTRGRGVFRGARDVQQLRDQFAELTAPDWSLLDPQRYEFTFVRTVFLGQARCFVFNVRPLNARSLDGFIGRVWIEDRAFNIVRYNGINLSVDRTLSRLLQKKSSFHVDGWRMNVHEEQWLPAYVYLEETDPRDSPAQPRIKAQMRVWGYNSQGPQTPQEFTDIHIDDPTTRDRTTGTRGLSPIESQRAWEREAEDNVLARLTAARFLAPPGDMDKVLETVVNNLAVTNDLTLDPPVRCRVLLTTPLESFTVGRTIVLSRGLIDAVPDEATLALMLAHHLAHIVLGHPLINTKFSFADRLMVDDGRLLGDLRFDHAQDLEAKTDAKVVETLKRSPYKNQLAGAGLFLSTIVDSAAQISNLITPHLGEHTADRKQVLRLSELFRKVPPSAPDRPDQIPALPLGARLIVDPWSGTVELRRTPVVPLTALRDKAPLTITAFMPYLEYASAPARSTTDLSSRSPAP